MAYPFKVDECKHTSIEKEYFLGAQTGDYICVDCGLTCAIKDDFDGLRNLKD